MRKNNNQIIRIAILDLYNGAANEGMRCLRQIIAHYSFTNDIEILCKEFDVRQKNEIPDLSFDIYLSSGGPGSPLESEGTEWERKFFDWIHQVDKWNNNIAHSQKKHVLFICHSFQLACRYYKIANVCKRKSTAFGVFPVHLLQDGKNETVFQEMHDPIYAVDSRDYQVIEPKHNTLQKIGATILAIEKERPHIHLERAIMAVRFNEYAIGTQFHPEADAIGMSMYLQTEEKKKTVIDNYGEDKWLSMIEQLNDPDKIMFTYSHIIPNFLNLAIQRLQVTVV